VLTAAERRLDRAFLGKTNDIPGSLCYTEAGFRMETKEVPLKAILGKATHYQILATVTILACWYREAEISTLS
jgi:hypothetical protein